jgi:hypothetical protein
MIRFPPLRPSLLLLALAAGLLLQGPATTQTVAGKKRALIVGVREYASARLDPLRFTENDAEALADVLQKQAGFSVRVLSTTRGKKRTADAPTIANLRAEIRALLADRTRHDTVLVALSGHGIQAKVTEGGVEKEESYFCPSDAQLNDNSKLLALGQLFKDLDTCGAAVKLLLVDACRNDPSLGRNVDVDTLPRLPRGTAALFSCKGGERAFESPKLVHGVFFYHVIDGLKGKAKNSDGEVTWSSLSEHVTKNVSRTVPTLIGGGARQTPELKVNLTGESPILVAAGKPVVAVVPSKPAAIKAVPGGTMPPQIKTLIVRLKDQDVKVRRKAAEGLLAQAKKAGPAVSALTQALKDRDLEVRTYAALALGQIGADARSALPALKVLLKDEDALPAAAARKAIQLIEKK